MNSTYIYLVRWPAWLNSLFKLLFTHNVKSIVRWQKILVAQNVWMCVFVYIHILLLYVFVSFTAAYTINTFCSKSLYVFCVLCKLRRGFFFPRLVNNHTETTYTIWNEMKWTLHLHVGNAEDASEHTLIHSGNSCHLLGIKLFTFQFRSFCYSRFFFSFVLFKYTALYTVMLGKLASMLNTLRWKLFVSWCTVLSVLFPNKMHARIVSCW